MPKPIDVVEALLFASDVPLEAERIREVLDLENAAAARELVGELVARYEAEERGLAIMETGGGWRMVTQPELAPWTMPNGPVGQRKQSIISWSTSSAEAMPSFTTFCASATIAK